MRIFRFDRDSARGRTDFGSKNFSLAPIIRAQAGLSVACIYLGKQGMLAWHPAVDNQLFLVVDGIGTVIGSDKQAFPIRAGQAAFWVSGEHHETRTEDGLTAIVIEGADVNPSQYMPEVPINDG